MTTDGWQRTVLRWACRAILAAAYYSVVTPLGMAARLFGRDRLSLRARVDRRSYWRPPPEF